MTRVRKRRLTFLLEHGSCTSSYDEKEREIRGGAGSVDGNRTASPSSPSASLQQTRMNHHCGAVNSLVLKSLVEGSRKGSANAKPSLFTASRDATIKRWQVNTGENNSEGTTVFGAAKLEMTFEGHVDWVNDVAVLGNTLVSCSNDCTVRLWKANASPKTKTTTSSARRDSRDNHTMKEADDYGLLSTLYEHSDYVMCVAAAEEAKTFVSAGLRSEIKLWDLGKMMKRNSLDQGDHGEASSNNKAFLKEFDCASAKDCSSCYACDINPSGDVLACGSTDGIVRIWDTRSNHANEEGGLLPQMALRGHVGNIRCIKVNRAGTMCITGSSDKTLRIWDLGQQRCMHSFSVHKDSVWALDFDEAHGQVVSGGRDGQVFCTNISNKLSTLLFEEEQPVLSVAAKSNGTVESAWSTTSSSSIHYWDLTQSSSREKREGGNGQSSRERRSSSFVASTSPFSISKSNSFKMHKNKEVVPLQASPSLTIVGVPAIIKHEILNNRQKILTEDTSGNICLWNVFTGSIEKQFSPEELGIGTSDLGEHDEGGDDGGRGEKTKKEKEEQESPFDKLLHRINPEVTVSSWFSADKRLGKLSIHMEPKQCFSTEVYAVDLGIKEVSDELKFNVGQQVTYSLFEKWDKGYNNSRDGGDERGAGDGDRDEPGAKGEGEKREKRSSPSSSPGKAQQKSSSKSNANKQADWPFSFKNNPCIITTTASGEWFRKRINDLDGSETSEVLPEWVVSCVADAQLPAGLDLKFSFHLLPTEDSDLPTLQQGKLLAPRILLVSKVLNYVANKLTEQNVDVVVNHSGQEQQQARDQKGVDANDLELLCNGKLLTPEMSLAKVRQSVWKRSDDIAIQYRVKG